MIKFIEFEKYKDNLEKLSKEILSEIPKSVNNLYQIQVSLFYGNQ